MNKTTARNTNPPSASAVRLAFSMILLFACALGARGQESFKRDIQQNVFIPKGQWLTGLSVAYSQSHQNNYQFFVVEGIDGDTYSFKVSPMLCYFVKDDLGLGGKFAYSRTRNKLNSADVVLSSSDSYDVNNLYSIDQSYQAMAIMRNYINLGDSKRFAFFNEVQLTGSVGESKIASGLGDDFTGSFEQNYTLGVGLAPGMVMFLNNYSAIEVNVGVLGFTYNHVKQTTDRIYVAHRNTTSANFRVNLFSISFGVAFYL